MVEETTQGVAHVLRVDHVEFGCLGHRVIGHFSNGQYVDRSRCLRLSFSLLRGRVSLRTGNEKAHSKRWRYRVIVRKMLTVEAGDCAA
jgi:hypothetical protein